MFIFVNKQSQLDDKDRTIRIQQNLINKLEAEVDRAHNGVELPAMDPATTVETVNSATQTERVRKILIDLFELQCSHSHQFNY